MTFSNVPVRVSGVADAIQVAVGDTNACAVRRSGGVVCWGAGDLTPVPVVGLSDVAQVEAGIGHVCARHEDGQISCWGQNDHGQLGTGTAGDPASSDVPIPVELAAVVLDVDVGINHTCALLETGEVHCWGSNLLGLLGTALPAGNADRPEPAPVEGLPAAIAIDGMFASTCARRSGAEVACWGIDAQESARLGTTAESRMARTVLGVSAGGDVAVGNTHACAVVASGGVVCWGVNSFGKLGDGTTDDRQFPVEVVGLP